MKVTNIQIRQSGIVEIKLEEDSGNAVELEYKVKSAVGPDKVDLKTLFTGNMKTRLWQLTWDAFSGLDLDEYLELHSRLPELLMLKPNHTQAIELYEDWKFFYVEKTKILRNLTSYQSDAPTTYIGLHAWAAEARLRMARAIQEHEWCPWRDYFTRPHLWFLQEASLLREWLTRSQKTKGEELQGVVKAYKSTEDWTGQMLVGLGQESREIRVSNHSSPKTSYRIFESFPDFLTQLHGYMLGEAYARSGDLRLRSPVRDLAEATRKVALEERNSGGKLRRGFVLPDGTVVSPGGKGFRVDSKNKASKPQKRPRL